MTIGAAPYVPTTDEVETCYSEHASMLAASEAATGFTGDSVAYPPEMADWQEATAAFRRWKERNDAEIREAARTSARSELLRITRDVLDRSHYLHPRAVIEAVEAELRRIDEQSEQDHQASAQAGGA